MQITRQADYAVRAQVAADELDVGFHQVRIVTENTEANPNEGMTTGSRSMEESGEALRFACAEVRALFMQAAAERLGASFEKLQVDEGMFHADGKQTSYWDLAATPDSDGADPDWTAGCLMHKDALGRLYIADMRRFRARPGDRDLRIHATAQQDGAGVPIAFEQEPGASGKSQIEYFVRNVLQGYRVEADRISGDKATRAGPLASQAEVGNVKLVRGAWNGPFLDELEAFDGSETTHDDQVDAASGAYHRLSRQSVVRVEELRL